MNDIYISLKASEDINNLSLCVVENNEIRNIRSIQETYMLPLVFVNNIPSIYQENNNFTINTGSFARCFYTLLR